MTKALVFITSVLWIPVALFLVSIVLFVALCLLGFLFFIVGTILLLLLRTCMRVQTGFYKTRRELLKEIDNELTNVPWWRLIRFKGKIYWKKIKYLI